jgi:hypothetical protein
MHCKPPVCTAKIFLSLWESQGEANLGWNAALTSILTQTEKLTGILPRDTA